jgi:hypothetical protein
VGYSAVKCANRGTGGYGFFHLLVCVSDHVLCFPFETTPWPCCCLVYGVGGLGELKYPLVSDLKKEISDAYGVLTGAWQAAVGPLVVCLACCACNNARHMLRHLLTTDAVWAHSWSDYCCTSACLAAVWQVSFHSPGRHSNSNTSSSSSGSLHSLCCFIIACTKQRSLWSTACSQLQQHSNRVTMPNTKAVAQ